MHLNLFRLEQSKCYGPHDAAPEHVPEMEIQRTRRIASVHKMLIRGMPRIFLMIVRIYAVKLLLLGCMSKNQVFWPAGPELVKLQMC